MRIIAIDPSLSCTGIAIFDDGNVIETFQIKTKAPTKKHHIDNRLEIIVNNFDSIVHAMNPEMLVIESQYFASNVKVLSKLSEVKGIFKGVYLSWCKYQGYKPIMIDITPTEAKHAVGVIKKMKSKVSKEAVKQSVLSKYPQFIGKSQDILDAVAIGLAGILRLNIQNITNKKVDKV